MKTKHDRINGGLKICLACAALLVSCTNPHRYVIEGQLDDFAGTLYLLDARQQRVDSVAVAGDGRFRFEGEVTVPDVAYISDATQAVDILFFLEPGTIAIPNRQEGRIRPTGTPSNDAIATISRQTKVLLDEFNDPATPDERCIELSQAMNQLRIDAYYANRGNIYSATLLLEPMGSRLSGQELLDEIALFPAELQQTDLLTEARAFAEQKSKTDVGRSCIDFGQPTADGGTMTLRSVVRNPANKYTLLDFWASWCGPCMGEVPYLVQTYREFHDKGFEIFAVSLDNNREHWLEAIERNGMNWLHVSDLQGWNNAAAADYGVRSIPANFLFDAEGRIVATNLRGEALRKQIAELLNEQ